MVKNPISGTPITPVWSSAHSRTELFYVFTGIAITVFSLFIGNSYNLSAVVLVVSLLPTVAAAGKHKEGVVILASLLAANPVNWTAAFPCNLIVACCFFIWNLDRTAKLPIWLYFFIALAFISFSFSSLIWFDSALALLQQGNHFLNFVLMPMLLLPVIYSEISFESDDHKKLKGLIYYLILPSTVILISAYVSGSPVTTVKTDELFNAMDIRVYKFVNTEVNFTRTHAGFLFGSMICGSAAILLTRVRSFCRSLAAVCLTVNTLLLWIVGSIGSSIATFCGLVAIFVAASFRVNVLRSAVSAFVLVVLLGSVWVITPARVKGYVQQRYSERVNGSGVNLQDRKVRWQHALDYSLAHPEGVGWSVSYGEKGRKSNAHNDYLLYAINFGVLLALAYLVLVATLLISFFNRSRRVSNDPSAVAVNLAGLGVTVVIMVNSISDHLVANKWYFNVLWSTVWYCYFCFRPPAQNHLSPKGVLAR